MSRNFLNELAQFQTELSEFSDDYLEDADNDERDEEFKETLLKIMRKAVDVVANAQKDEAENLPGIVEKAESLLNEAISLAYEGSTDESDLGQSLFESLDSFAHTVEHPLAKPPPEAEGVFPHRIVKVGLMMMKMMGGAFGIRHYNWSHL
ncbi:hypothetical protein NMY22_g7660 [Coprinellus aureogranulatus]|nr:hypothetical protein NMY22_g7660 [Coprinellus aureogranulatus]